MEKLQTYYWQKVGGGAVDKLQATILGDIMVAQISRRDPVEYTLWLDIKTGLDREWYGRIFNMETYWKHIKKEGF